MTSSILESNGMEDDLKVLTLKMEVPIGIGRFFLKPLHLQASNLGFRSQFELYLRLSNSVPSGLNRIGSVVE